MALKRINKVRERSERVRVAPLSVVCPVYAFFFVFRPPPHPPSRSAWRAVAAACARRWPRCPFPSCPRGLHARDGRGVGPPRFPAASPSHGPRVADNGSGRSVALRLVARHRLNAVALLYRSPVPKEHASASLGPRPNAVRFTQYHNCLFLSQGLISTNNSVCCSNTFLTSLNI